MTSSKNTTKMIPLITVMPDIYRILGQESSMTEDEILESAASAASHFYNYKFYERALIVEAIDNYKCILPNYSEIIAVFYRSDLVPTELDDLIYTVQIDNSNTKVTDAKSPINRNYYASTPYGKISKKSIYNCKRLAYDYGWRPMILGHSIRNMYSIYLDEKRQEIENNKDPLCDTVDPSSSKITKVCECTPGCTGQTSAISCNKCSGKTIYREETTTDNCTNISSTTVAEPYVEASTGNILGSGSHNKYRYSKCDYTYSIKGDVLTTSQNSGYAMILYKRTCRDEDDNILIPSHPLVNEAIKAYVLMEYMQRESIYNPQSNFKMYQVYANKWEALSAAASGEIIKPSLPEYVEMQNLNRMFKGENGSSIYDNIPYESIRLGMSDRIYGQYI